KVWNFGGFHVDAPPRVAGGRVYAGCGIGDEFKTTALLCLDAKDGSKPIWRAPMGLPVWGRPVVSGGFVYVGAGNGRVSEAGERRPAGMRRFAHGPGDLVARAVGGDEHGPGGDLVAGAGGGARQRRLGGVAALRRRDARLDGAGRRADLPGRPHAGS